MKTLILGLGSPGLEGERVGLEVARGLHATLSDPEVDIIEMPAGGVALFEIVAGYHKVIIVDCVKTGEGGFGELCRLGLEDLELVPQQHTDHGVEYRAKISAGGVHQSAMPGEISVYAIEVANDVVDNEGMEIVARDAVSRLVDEIAREEFGDRIRESGWY
ncbi:hydrogenase maturation protease [bacterium]|nr:hydrogenase maturation protease [bacterium]